MYRNRKGLTLFANLTAAHVRASSHAKQWLQGLHADLLVVQQGSALSQEWLLNPGLLALLVNAVFSDVEAKFANVLG